jgi:ubiquinone/menaquinone biosynthesis C-methylase UbiE
MSFDRKFLSGEETSPEEWREHLREVHGREPGISSVMFAPLTTPGGRSSYEMLVDRAAVEVRSLGRPVDVLDLACGDGYLVDLCLRELGDHVATITGVDMSEDELALARRRLGITNARLELALAQSLPLADGSVDVALCHAAFMLMLPVEPVVAELTRVLRPGAIFSAVVAATSLSPYAGDSEELRGERELWADLRSASHEYWQSAFPNLQTEGRVGDGRTMTTEGWQELFATDEVEANEFEVLVREPPEGIWTFFRDTYLAMMLEEQERKELRKRVVATAEAHVRDGDGMVTMAFPLRRFTVRRGR